MPRPKKHVFVCAQNRPPNHPRGACAHRGAGDLLQAFGAELQARNAFDTVAVTYAGCLGPCHQGANVLVYPEGILYSGVTKDDVAEICESHLLGDAPVERLRQPESVW